MPGTGAVETPPLPLSAEACAVITARMQESYNDEMLKLNVDLKVESVAAAV